MRLFWHRRDLRAVDNRGLSAAAADGPVVSAFVLDGDVLAHAAPPRVACLLDALESLRAWYRDRGSDLLVRRGDPASVIPSLAAERDADAVVWNDDYSGLAQERDEATGAALEEAGVTVERHHDALLHEPGSITTREGDHYSVFSYFREKWRDREKDDPLPAPEAAALADATGDPLPGLDDLGFEAPSADLPAGGRPAARERLERFRDGPIRDYEEDREYPARAGTARISQDLKFGTLGVREAYAATEAAMADAGDDSDRSSVEEWRSQLAWREFYAHVLAARPDVVTDDYRPYEGEIEWRNDPAELEAWKAGETGYPLVDAGMRQLRAEAFVHNRVRMVAASFLTKDLLWDWRAGYDHFRAHLVDHDPANDSGGWQWAASTGTDAQPYFRVFNPATQCEKYDPDGEYVREHVPELRGVDAETVHEWPDLDAEAREAAAPDYAAPVVDHDERREAALAAFEAAREGG
ncbi:MAG: deoxyribodipyrimidine photo-lyase [Halobacteriaceae archaeon]